MIRLSQYSRQDVARSQTRQHTHTSIPPGHLYRCRRETDREVPGYEGVLVIYVCHWLPSEKVV